jgi:ribosome modulation factor
VRLAVLRRALRAGRSAALAGRPVTVCPYPAGTLRELFVRGYVAARAELRTA